MTPTYYLVLSALLFGIGAVGVLVRRNAIVVFMCIELMLNAVNLSFVTFSRINGNLDGVVMAFCASSQSRAVTVPKIRELLRGTERSSASSPSASHKLAKAFKRTISSSASSESGRGCRLVQNSST